MRATWFLIAVLLVLGAVGCRKSESETPASTGESTISTTSATNATAADPPETTDTLPTTTTELDSATQLEDEVLTPAERSALAGCGNFTFTGDPNGASGVSYSVDTLRTRRMGCSVGRAMARASATASMAICLSRPAHKLCRVRLGVCRALPLGPDSDGSEVVCRRGRGIAVFNLYYA